MNDGGSILQDDNDEFQDIDVEKFGVGRLQRDGCTNSGAPKDVEPEMESGAVASSSQKAGIAVGDHVGVPIDDKANFCLPKVGFVG